MVLLSAQGMDVAQIAKVAFTSPDRVREVLHNFNDDGFESLAPKYAGGRPPKFTLPERREIKKIALSRPMDHGVWAVANNVELAYVPTNAGWLDAASRRSSRPCVTSPSTAPTTAHTRSRTR